MQLIATKVVPPPSPAVLSRVARSQQSGQARLDLLLEVRYCPSIDLLATYHTLVRSEDDTGDDDAEDQQDGPAEDPDGELTVSVWRLSGQKVFDVIIDADEQPMLEIVDVAWKDDGRILAVLSSDNLVRLVDSYSAKIVHQYCSISTHMNPRSPLLTSTLPTPQRSTSAKSTTTPGKLKCTRLSYSTHFADCRTAQRQLAAACERDNVTLDDLLSLNADVDTLLKSHAELPHELANVDLEASLPKLACLPPAGFGMDDVFSTRSSIDTLFPTSKRRLRSGIIDIVAVGSSQSTIHLRLFDSFEIGDVELDSALHLPKGFICGPILRLQTHPFYDGALAILQEQRQKSLHLFHIGLGPLSRASKTLPILATKATQLHNLLRYLLQIQSQLVKEVNTAFDLPARFLRNIEEDLEKQGGPGCTFVSAAYHTIVTGEVGGVLKEWLTDQLGDRGVKRWEKAVTDCLELVRRLISENWNPAVERLGLVVSRLMGLAKADFANGSDEQGLGIDKAVTNGLRETVDMMTIVGEELLRDVNQELTQFACFIRWIKWEVEAAALEDTSERLDEMREGSDHNEVTKVLEYLDGGPTKTVIKNYLGTDVKQNSRASSNGETYAEFKKNRRRTSGKQAAPTMGDLLAQMQSLCKRLFEQVASTIRQKIMTTYLTPVPHVVDGSLMDAKIIPDEHAESFKLCIVGQSLTERGEILYCSINLVNEEKTALSAKPQSSSTVSLELPGAGQVSDIKFVDDSCFMVLESARNGAQIYEYTGLQDSHPNRDLELRHVFDGGSMESGMRPARLEINGRKGRRAVVVIDQQGKGYSVYDLDSGDGDGTSMEAGDDAVMTG